MKFKDFYTGTLYVLIFLFTLVAIFTPFWIVGELFRLWIKGMPFNWWCLIIEFSALFSLAVTMTIAGAKTKEDIEAINPYKKAVQSALTFKKLPKHERHDWYWVENETLYEALKNEKNTNPNDGSLRPFQRVMSVPGLPDRSRLDGEDIEYVEKTYQHLI